MGKSKGKMHPYGEKGWENCWGINKKGLNGSKWEIYKGKLPASLALTKKNWDNSPLLGIKQP